MRCALSIAGSDSIGGAGIQADVKAMAAVGVHAHTVVTAITAQNTCSVKRIMPVPVDMITDQIDSVMSDSDVRAIKTGMLYDGDIVDAVVERLERREVPLVVDPVLVAGVGDSLAADDLTAAIKRELIPVCDILTPNRHEAEALTGLRIENEDDARRACEILGKEGTTIYLKGGHMDSRNVIDTLYNGAEFKRFEYPRLERAGHGGGCILSSYITAHLAKGMDAVNSIINSRKMIQESIASMYAVGKCDKVVNPMARMKDVPERSDVLDALNDLADRLVRILPKEWIPKDGANAGYALPNPKGPQDVASIKGRITISNGRVRRNGAAEYGASGSMGRFLTAVMRHDAGQRAAISLMCSRDLASIMEEVGLTGMLINGNVRDITELTSNAIRKNGSVPDVVIYGKHPNGAIIVLGRDPKDLMGKINSIL